MHGSKAIRKLLWDAENRVGQLFGGAKTIATADGDVQATVIADYTPGVFDDGALALEVVLG